MIARDVTGATASQHHPLGALAAPATWLTAAHLLCDAVFGAAYTVILLIGLIGSLMLFPVAMAGLPVWIITVHVSNLLARLELRRHRALLGARITPQPLPTPVRNPLRYGGVLVRDPGVRRRALYQLISLPKGVLISGITYFVLSGTAALLLLPLTTLISEVNGSVFGIPVDTAPSQALFATAGLLALAATPTVLRGLSQLDISLAQRLLGPVPEALAQRVDELERSRARVVDASEAERRRLERDLHDGTQQRLVALGMTLGRALARYRKDPADVGELLEDAHRQAKETLVELRGLIRGLHPPVLTDRGLDAALSAVAARCPVPVDMTVEIDERPPATVEAVGYFVVSEALANVAKHSGATRATVTVRREGHGSLWITVTDNGRGGADPTSGTGLRGLADRVAGVDGQFSIDSPHGGPTVLTVEIPCDE